MRKKDAGLCYVVAGTTSNASQSDALSVVARYADVDSRLPKERLLRIIQTIIEAKDNYEGQGGQAEDIVKCLKLSDIPLSTVMFQTTTQLPVCQEDLLVLKRK